MKCSRCENEAMAILRVNNTPICTQCFVLEAASAERAAGRSPVSAPVPGSADTPKPSTGQLGHSADESDAERRRSAAHAETMKRFVELQKAAVLYVTCLRGETSFEHILVLADDFSIAAIAYAEAKRREDARPRGGQACPPNSD